MVINELFIFYIVRKVQNNMEMVRDELYFCSWYPMTNAPCTWHYKNDFFNLVMVCNELKYTLVLLFQLTQYTLNAFTFTKNSLYAYSVRSITSPLHIWDTWTVVTFLSITLDHVQIVRVVSVVRDSIVERFLSSFSRDRQPLLSETHRTLPHMILHLCVAELCWAVGPHTAVRTENLSLPNVSMFFYVNKRRRGILPTGSSEIVLKHIFV